MEPTMSAEGRRSERGQTLVLFALALLGLVLMAGLVVDGGYALAQRRSAQNAADFAAMAGTRVVGANLSGDPTGTDANAKQAVEAALTANGIQTYSTGAPAAKLYTARYVNQTGAVVGNVGDYAGLAVPATARGVIVEANKSWKAFLTGVAGITNWSAGATATAISPATNVSAGVMPFGVSASTLGAHAACPLGTPVGDPTAGCATFHLTPGSTNVPGGFGWLKFGCTGPDADGKNYGLGQVPPANAGGCSSSKTFLDSEWGSLPTTPAKTYGCCTSVAASTAAGFGNDIGSLPGNKASVNDGTASVSYMEANNLVGWAPVWDSANGNGSHGYYHIIGYVGFQVVHIKGGKDIEGVIRLKGPGPGGTYDAPDDSLLSYYAGTVQLTH
jgi:Flp pilus assembly protein TadG